MASKTGNRNKMKKSVHTLGNAAVTNNNPHLVDLSSVQKPIDTSIFGLRQVLSLFDTATEEVRRYITFECDIIYECRICRSMYRSLANFILHKRNYCRDSFTSIHNNSSNDMNNDLKVIQVNEEEPSEIPVKLEVEKNSKRNLNSVLRRLCNKQTPCDVASYDKDSNTNELKNKLVLEKISSNSAGVFQTFHMNSADNALMKTEVMEIHNIFSPTEAILGPDGKVISTQNTENVLDDAYPRNQNIVCTICNLKFSTKKTLTHHIKYQHSEIRIIYFCPECKDTFANAWCVFRHLYKVHHKNTSQIRKIRDQVHANAIEMKRNFLLPKPHIKFADTNSFEQENQWINDIECDNDLQMCGGCGKRFERKAALNSHSHLCMKRLAVCNTLKKKHFEDNYKLKTNGSSGAKKRKPKILKKPRQYISSSTENATSKQETNTEVTGCYDVSVILEPLNQNALYCKIKNENNPVINIDERKLQKTAIEEIILGSVPSDAITDLQDICVETIRVNDDNKEKQSFSFKDTETFVRGDIPEINEQTLILESSYIGDTSNSKLLDETEIKNCDIQIFNDIKTNFSCDKNNECLWENSNPNNFIQSINTENLNIAPETEKLTNILKKFQKHNNRKKKHNTLTNNNNSNTEIQNIKENLDEKIEEVNEDKYVDRELELENKSSEFLTLKEKECIDTTSEKNYEKTDYCNEKPDILYDVTEELNFSKSDQYNKYDNASENLIDDSGKFDTQQSCRDKGLFSLYDDNSNSLTNLEFSENEIKRTLQDDADPKSICDIAYAEAEHINNSADMKGTKRKSSFDEEYELDDLTLEIKSKEYINVEKLCCLPCNLTFTSKSFLIKHMSQHFNWFCFQCSKCSFMSYDRQACIQHIDIHKIQSELLDNIVLPIPHWKTVNLCTDFSNLCEQVQSKSEGIVKSIEKESRQQKNKVTLTEANKNDPMLRKMIMEVIFGSESQLQENREKSELTENTRPIRNRTSIQKIQKDFVYDMKQIDMKVKEKIKVKPIKIVKGVDTHFKVVRTAPNNTYRKRKKAID